MGGGDGSARIGGASLWKQRAMSSRVRGVLVLLVLLAFALVRPAQAADTVVYYHTDALRSVAEVTNASGAVIERTHYAPHGQVLNRSLRDGPGYAGHREDAATGLVYMQARYYDPESGRFLSADPVQADGNGGNFNRYWYANDNPYRYMDPFGEQSVGEMIDSAAQGCGAVSCAGYAVLSAAWKLAGAEPLSQLADKGWSGTSTSEKIGAALAVAAVLPVGRVVEEATVAKEVTLTVGQHGEAAIHAADAIKAGKPDVLTIARDSAPANRAAATGGLQKVPGKQLDEYPPAMFKEGGAGASVRAVKPSDNMSAGACLGNACRGLPNGAKIRIKVKDQE